MIALTAEVLAGWTLIAILTAFALGVKIRMAEKVRADEILEAYYVLCAAAKHHC